MKEYQIMRLEAEAKCKICELIERYIESEKQDIERYENRLTDYVPEEQEDRWEVEAIEEAKQHIQFAEQAIEHILNGGKSK